MIDIRLEVDIDPALRMIAKLTDDLPFVTSVALNEAAKAFQQRQREHMMRAFVVRREQWVRYSVKITEFSHKNRRPLQARIAISPPGGLARADILAKFESGGIKRPRGTSIAIPVAARPTLHAIVGKYMRPKAFRFRHHGRGPKATVFVGARRTFLIRYHSAGAGGIYQRVGSGGRAGVRERGRDVGLKTLYRFTAQASIDRRLRFVENAEGVVQASFARSFDQALQMYVGPGGDIGTAGRQGRRIARADVFDVGRGP